VGRRSDVKILIVEDNDLNRELLCRRFLHRGFEVLTEADGQSAVATAAREKPDAILMDLSLPVVDGWEATRRLKAASDTAHIPVIALSAHALSEDRDAAMAAGCSDYVTKPIDFTRLFEAVARYEGRQAG
jgi:CheY-like chemotaxis protein